MPVVAHNVNFCFVFLSRKDESFVLEHNLHIHIDLKYIVDVRLVAIVFQLFMHRSGHRHRHWNDTHSHINGPKSSARYAADGIQQYRATFYYKHILIHNI